MVVLLPPSIWSKKEPLWKVCRFWGATFFCRFKSNYNDKLNTARKGAVELRCFSWAFTRRQKLKPILFGTISYHDPLQAQNIQNQNKISNHWNFLTIGRTTKKPQTSLNIVLESSSIMHANWTTRCEEITLRKFKVKLDVNAEVCKFLHN